ncbi:4-alpha-glucanotransferase [Clostridium cibarium]|uniref:4-alpha-glucanotransferase n=1 Tax=Clostridium cibarium TaxID=2762247 RepID=A0ABR8PY19_9CLOT|nr:4-alpha-glucanotransferase [Clostridium cibarium]MBD7913070.1 4-alpha-glucanotransferase [Clostridium cibarium]
MADRSYGTLVHPSCFRTKYGIGDFGAEAYKFVDFLKKSKQRYWQILPIEPCDNENSPYKCHSAFAGNELLISIDLLVRDGLINNSDIKFDEYLNKERVDYEKCRKLKYKYYRIAYDNFKKYSIQKDEYEKFCNEEEEWLKDYSLYIALSNYFKKSSWVNWEMSIVNRNHEAISYYENLLVKEIEFQKFLQYIFLKQWLSLKKYANENGIKIIGDLAMYVSHNSCDVWVNKDLFKLDNNNKPVEVSGFPADPFFGDDQVWGHPVYDWDRMKEEDFNWWMKRINNLLKKIDVIRFDHFRGFESYWVIPIIDGGVGKGYWKKGPSYDFFNAVINKFGKIPIIVEDLGYTNEEIVKLKDFYSFMGIKVLQYGVEYYEKYDTMYNTVTYLGTHDNDPILGWYKSLCLNEQLKIKKLVDISCNDKSSISWGFISYAMKSISKIVIIPVQDILSLGREGRMNTPGTLGGNWEWTFDVGELNSTIINKISKIAMLYERNT